MVFHQRDNFLFGWGRVVYLEYGEEAMIPFTVLMSVIIITLTYLLVRTEKARRGAVVARIKAEEAGEKAIWSAKDNALITLTAQREAKEWMDLALQLRAVIKIQHNALIIGDQVTDPTVPLEKYLFERWQTVQWRN